MRVSPVGLDGCGPCPYQPLDYAPRSDQQAPFGGISGGANKADSATLLFSTIRNINQNSYGLRDRVLDNQGLINTWLQYPNALIRSLALKIVKSSDSDDVKVEKIQRWVVHNIAYMTDEDQYGYEELWVPPVMVLRSQKGDCEDGAFLIMSLALNAGVDASRLRMYGGFVDAGPGAASGGHGWVAYRRQSDNQWVAVDFSYYPDLGPMSLRLPLKEDEKYVDDYFYMTRQYIVYTEMTNRVREPDVYYSNGRVMPNIFFPAGTMLSLHA